MIDFCNLLKRICHLRLIKHLQMKKRKQCQPNSNLYSTARLQLRNVLVFSMRLILLIRSWNSWRNDSLGNHNTDFLIVFLYSIRQTKFNERKVIMLISMMTCKYSVLPSLVELGWNKPQNPYGLFRLENTCNISWTASLRQLNTAWAAWTSESNVRLFFSF